MTHFLSLMAARISHMTGVESIRTIAISALLAAALTLATPAIAAKAKPKPWQWTPAQAASKLDTALSNDRHAFGDEAETFRRSTCRGTGRQTAGRFIAFTCTVTGQAGAAGQPVIHRAWVKVRTAGRGGACVSVTSLAAVSRACLAARGIAAPSGWTRERPAPEGAIQNATTARFNPTSTIPWQGFSRLDCLGVDGWYQCSFESSVSGTATVSYKPSGPPVVAFIALTCTGAYAGHPRCVPGP